MTRIPTSTYRLQLHGAFGFDDAARLAGYLKQLGIGDLYASPILAARSGSQHGYDVTDPTQLNPELGGREGFERLAGALRERQLGLLLDIVPNHMAASLENPWWRDVLANGRKSAYAGYFDIDWNSSIPGLAGKVLLPILGAPFGEVLENGELILDHDGDDFTIRYFDLSLPISLESRSLIQNAEDPAEAIRMMAGTPGEPESFDALEALIEAQHYRLAFWQVGRDVINYRRFFDVSDLVSLRAEDDEVFQATHRLLLDLIERGDITGLRIDHIDGLSDPSGYLARLQEHLPHQGTDDEASARRTHFYVAVEKILAADEGLPEDWRTDGTSGYDFLNVLNGVFVERRAEADLDRIYARLRGAETDFSALVHERKHQVMAELFSGDINRLARDLWTIAAATRDGHDLMLVDLEAALTETIANLQVYRTYTQGYDVAPADRRRIEHATGKARDRRPDLKHELRFLNRVLLLETPDGATGETREQWRRFVVRWQQFTGPIMAKGFEDTSLYVYNRLISLNEVGGDPDPMGVPLADLHAWAEERQAHWPGAINATSTHDTKRSEDVRARINVLSEIPEEWDAALTHWQNLNRERKREVDGVLVPDGNEDHLIYETMAGAWPFDPVEVPEFRERMQQYIIKAAREAKTHTSWTNQNVEYEDALTGFLGSIISDDRDDPFMQNFGPLQRLVAFHGALNSLSQTLLKITLPGVPDFYQGTELWDLSLVDPDNRRPVDFGLRSQMLEGLNDANQAGLVDTLVEDWPSGRIKLYVIYRALQVRNQHRRLFETGDYLALSAGQDTGRHVIGFARNAGEEWVLSIAPRLTVGLARGQDLPTEEMPLGDAYWGDLAFSLPPGAPVRWRNVFTGEKIDVTSGGDVTTLRVANALKQFPVALLVPDVQ